MTLTRIIALPVLLAVMAVAPGIAFATNGTSPKMTFQSQTFVQISEDGNTLVRGAEVTALAGNTVMAETDLGGVDIAWTIETDGSTDFVRHGGGSFDLDDLEIGDTVSFSGDLTGRFSVDADVLKEWSSPSAERIALSGTVHEVNGGSFELADTRLGTITVDVTSDTTFVGKKGDSDYSDIEVGQHVAVSGNYDAENEVLTASKVSIDARLHADFGAKVKGWFETHMNFWKK